MNFVDWMLHGREKPEGQNAFPVERCPIPCLCPARSSFALSCQEGFQAWAHSAGALGTGDTAFIANSHHRQYRWGLYTGCGPLRSQVSEISWLGFAWRWWRETGTSRRDFIPPYIRCLGGTPPRHVVPAALLPLTQVELCPWLTTVIKLQNS